MVVKRIHEADPLENPLKYTVACVSTVISAALDQICPKDSKGMNFKLVISQTDRDHKFSLR